MKKLVSIVLSLMVACTAIYAKEPHKGYRGFVELDATIGKAIFDDHLGGDKEESGLFLGLSTSHGYQIDNHSFVGAGVMVSTAFPPMMLPVFAEYRYDARFGKFTPYADFRLGYSFVDGGSLYLSPTVGYRVSCGRKANFNVGLGYTLCGESDKYLLPGGKEWVKDHKLFSRFSLRIGFDF